MEFLFLWNIMRYFEFLWFQNSKTGHPQSVWYFFSQKIMERDSHVGEQNIVGMK